MRSITAREAKERLQNALDGEKELAFLDVREVGQYGEGHPFFVVNLPYSRLELEAEALLPRKTVEILLLDEDDGVGDRAARRLAGLGYAQVSRIEGGVAGWEAAGYGLFKGVNLPSKAFGELVEAELHTPAIGPEELARRLASENSEWIRCCHMARFANRKASAACQGPRLWSRLKPQAPAPASSSCWRLRSLRPRRS